jgi:hypothetical protein
MVSQLNTWEYSRNRSEIEKAIDIIKYCYSDASINGKYFFWNYYLYRVVKRISICISTCFLLAVLSIISIMQIDWHYGKEITFGVLLISCTGLMFIIIAKECKNIRNIVVEHKSLTAQIIPS